MIKERWLKKADMCRYTAGGTQNTFLIL